MIFALIVVSSILACQDATALDVDFERFQWKKRLLFIFAPESTDPFFNTLVNEITARKDDVDDRDLVVFEILESGVSSMNRNELDPQQAASLRRHFKIPQSTFAVILLGKDGTQKLKRDGRVELDEIFRLVDSMPMRKDEMRKQKP